MLAACTKETGADYYECLFIIEKNRSAKSSSADAKEICTQQHPPRMASQAESESIGTEIYSRDSLSSHKQLKITNNNSNFIATEVIIQFRSPEGKEVTISFKMAAKPYEVTWTEYANTDIEGPFQAGSRQVKGRSFK